MGFRGDISKLVASAFEIVGDLKEKISVTYVVSGGPYNPTTDAMNNSETTISGIGAVFTQFTMAEIDSSVVVTTDVKVLIPALSLSGIVPKENDYLINDTSFERFDIMNVKRVPGDSLFIIHVRRR